MVDLTGKNVVVVGLGSSGIAACRLCVARGAHVVGTDLRTTPPGLDRPSGGRAACETARGLEGVELVLGTHASLDRADLVVVSPGVPMFQELGDALARGVRVWGEIELAVSAMKHPAPIVAIGGTNGKSTTTSLVGELLEASGRRTFVGGNLGEPLAAHADEPFDAVVLEVSSFQLERLETFHPKVSTLLNITPDHLDRYANEAEYADAKGNAFVRQTADDLAVVPVDDPVCLAQARRGQAAVVTFGPGGDVDVRSEAIVDGERAYPRERIGLQGGHNALNVAAALATVRPFAIAPERVMSVLSEFRGLAHRMAFVRELRGVRFYDDSKGTNVGASVTAVRGIAEKRVVLVAGGKDKGGSYAPLAEALRERGRAAVLIGEAAPLIADAVGSVVPVLRAASMKEAVRLAADAAREGDAVLLSPACSSFDMFKDYKDRGDAFVREVMELP
jgi:UDP-N-acetylmuramoylalanine--D-glutamate ligase